MLSAIQQSQAWFNFQNQLPNRQAWQLDGFFVYKLSVKKNLHFLYLPGLNAHPSTDFWHKLQKLAKDQNCAFCHIEPYRPTTEPPLAPIGATKLSPFHYIETWTRYLDLSLTEEELLAQMKSKGRYNLNLAQKKGITIKTETNIDNFYNLLAATTERDGFAGHPKTYYQTMHQTLGDQHCRIWTAFYNNTPVASIIATFFEETATYYYGASSNEHRNLMAPYLIQWEAIKYAKANGCLYYDFMGIEPPEAVKHPLAGVSRFKAQFGGQVIQFQPATDLVYSKLQYYPYYIYKVIK
ncbi:hypothetical protein COY06_04305 [Candidatus Peregrinibacteria bacterium CG_4_10_14_0_2_um_filter_41_8]|nr:MAG: hypothetical protein COY06_04305 [Candidatus Peregrinibacteria bacterium CG_4_10_14_0_2_um_filter_41_8]